MEIVREAIEKMYPSCLDHIHIGEHDKRQHCVSIKFDYRLGEMIISEDGSCMTPTQTLEAKEWMTLAKALTEIANNYEPKKGDKQ